MPGDGTSFFTITHNTDFAKGFVGLIGNIHAIGHAFHITSDEPLTWDQVIAEIGGATGVKPDVLHIPSDFIIAFDPIIIIKSIMNSILLSSSQSKMPHLSSSTIKIPPCNSSYYQYIGLPCICDLSRLHL